MRARYQKLIGEFKAPSYFAQHELVPPRFIDLAYFPLLHDPRQPVLLPME